MTTVASQITSLAVVYSIVYSDADERKHQSSASLAFVRGISPGPVNSPHKGPVTRKMFPFDDVIMMTVGHGVWTNTRHPRARPNEKAMGVFCEYFGKISLRLTGTTRYQAIIVARLLILGHELWWYQMGVLRHEIFEYLSAWRVVAIKCYKHFSQETQGTFHEMRI